MTGARGTLPFNLFANEKDNENINVEDSLSTCSPMKKIMKILTMKIQFVKKEK